MKNMEERIYAVKQALVLLGKDDEENREMLLMLVEELDRALEDI